MVILVQYNTHIDAMKKYLSTHFFLPSFSLAALTCFKIWHFWCWINWSFVLTPPNKKFENHILNFSKWHATCYRFVIFSLFKENYLDKKILCSALGILTMISTMSSISQHLLQFGLYRTTYSNPSPTTWGKALYWHFNSCKDTVCAHWQKVSRTYPRDRLTRRSRQNLR